jgi:regulator of replication initiation timing
MAKTTTKKEKFDSDYFLDQIVKINDNIMDLMKKVAELQENLNIVNENAQYSIDEIESWRPRIEQALGRMGL